MATDFQSLLSSQNVACYLNLSPGEQFAVKLALLQDIARALGISVITLNTSGLVYGPPHGGVLHYVAVPVTPGGVYVVTPGADENGVYLDLTGDGIAANIATGQRLTTGVSVTVTAVSTNLYFEGGQVGVAFTGVITQDPFTIPNLLLGQNVACYSSMPPDMQYKLKLALLQIILTNLPSGGGTTPTWAPPASLPNVTLVEWLKGDTLTGGSGSPIADWPASVGFDAIQGGGIARPTVLIGTYALPVARFNGSSDLLTVTGIPVPSQPYTIAMVFSFKGNPANQQVILDASSTGPFFGNVSSNFVYNAGSNSVQLKATDSNPHIVFLVINGAASTFAFDGVSLATMSANPGSQLMNAMNIGASGSPSFFAQVDVGEILVWTGDCTASYAQIFNYLTTRWQIQ